ncbi:MAG TPA: competence protein CoiA family protein [Acidimicrobiia bacterium]|nr:competence protein CoiA family protein [Acidimicrobiia bacterium]
MKTAREEIRCPSCARLLVLRSGPQVTPHYAHRPRQSCRRGPGGPAGSPLRLEQLTLFEVEAVPLLESFERDGGPVVEIAVEIAVEGPAPVRAPVRRRPRRRAWLPRLIRWLRGRAR